MQNVDYSRTNSIALKTSDRPRLSGVVLVRHKAPNSAPKIITKKNVLIQNTYHPYYRIVAGVLGIDLF